MSLAAGVSVIFRLLEMVRAETDAGGSKHTDMWMMHETEEKRSFLAHPIIEYDYFL